MNVANVVGTDATPAPILLSGRVFEGSEGGGAVDVRHHWQRWLSYQTESTYGALAHLRQDEQLEQRLAEFEHMKLVEQASRASAKSLAAGWDNPLDAQYDNL